MAKLIRDSNIWKSLNAPLTSKFDEIELIDPQPVEFKLPDDIKFNDFDKAKLLQFHKTQNKTLSGNINHFPEILFDNLALSCFTTITANNEIISFALATIIPIRVKKNYNVKFEHKDWEALNAGNTLLFGYTNYLCAHQDYRNIQKGINAVKATLNYGIPRGVLCGYFIGTSPKTSNFIELNNWIRSLNFSACRSAKFLFPDHRKPGDKSELRNELFYKIKIDEKYKYDLATSKNLKDFKKLSINYKFVLAPNAEFWNKWISIFKTYVVIYDGKVVGIGSFLVTETLISQSGKILRVANIVFCIGDPIILKILLDAGTKLGAGIATGYGLGILTDTVLSDAKTVNSGKMFLEFYNTSIRYSPEQVCVPIF
jgi:hypothetical protein